MIHEEDAIKNAEGIIAKHQANGLSLVDVRKAAIVSVETVLSVIFAQRNETHSLYTRTLNYLNDTASFLKYPIWFNKTVQGVVKELWFNGKPGENYRMACINYLQEEADRCGEKIFIADAIDLIKTTVE